MSDTFPGAGPGDRRGTARWQPGPLAGFRLGSWLRLLRENAWGVDRDYLPRALAATVGATATSVLAPVDAMLARRPIDEDAWRRPLFVVGLPRSGTTWLFELLALDPRRCFPTMLDAFNPHSMLTLRALGAERVLGGVRPKKRFMDAVRTHWLGPFEDEFALVASTRIGPAAALFFPRSREKRRGEAILSRAPEEARLRFRSALAGFTRKLVLLHGRPVLLKSPAHLARIPDILAVFPEARFVAIFRDPADQLTSFRSMDAAPDGDWCALQRDLGSERGSGYGPAAILDEYFRTCGDVQPGHLVEIRYEDLVAAPEKVVDGIYRDLGLPGRDEICERVRADLAARPRYEAGGRPPLDAESRAMLRDLYRPLYERGMYPLP